MNSIARIPNVIGIIMYLGHFSPQQYYCAEIKQKLTLTLMGSLFK